MKETPEQDPARIRVLLVDDHPMVRAGLTRLLEVHPGIVVAAALPDGISLLERLPSVAADVILLDLRMPGMSGVEVLETLRERSIPTRVLIVSGFEFDEEIHAAIQAGARGYVPKDAGSDEIAEAVRAVHAGRTAFPARIAERLAARELTAGLSTREREILTLVAKGLTNKEIATALHLSPFTVRNHLNHITSKLEASDRTEAAYIALHTGVLLLP